MKFRGTLIVLVAALALGGFVYFHEMRGGSERARRKAASEKLLGIDPQAVTALRITHTGTLFDLAKRGDSWWLLRPVPAPADPRVVPPFVDSLAAARREENVGKGDLVKYGLDAPAAVIEIEVGGKTRKLELGRINPLQTLVYVRVDGQDDILLTSSALLTVSLNNTFGWRAKRMIDVDPESVTRLSMRTLQDGDLAIRKDAAHGWRVEGPVPWRVDPLRARSLVESLARLDAVGIAAENKEKLAQYGLDNRRMGVQVEIGGSVAGDLVVGMGDGEGAQFGIVPDKPEVFRVDAKTVEAWWNMVRAPQDRKAFPPFNPERITSIRVRTPDDEFELRRLSAVDWKVAASTKADTSMAIASGAVDALLGELAALEVAGWPERQPQSVTYDPATIQVLLFDSGKPVSGLDVGKKDPNGYNLFARAPGEPAVFLLSPAALLKVPYDLDRLKADEAPAPQGADRG